MSKVKIGYQLYSAREEMQEHMAEVFGRLKEMGYDGVEFAGFFGKSAAEIKTLLDETGLKAVSSHVPLEAIRQDMFGTIAYHQAIGCKYIAVPFLDGEHRPGTPGFAGVIRLIAAFGRLCREAGIQLLYHNHDFEFVQVSGMYGLDFLYAAVEPEILQTEIDVCWVRYAGEDPAAYLRKYTGRAPVVHLKDYVGVKGEGTPYGLLGQKRQADAVAFEFRPFGYGCQDVKAVTDAGIEAGAEWFVIEQDQWYDRKPLEAAKMSIDTLKKLGM